MKLDRRKYEVACARACMNTKDILAAGFPQGTLCHALGGKGIRPRTVGELAKILGCDVTEIID